MNHNWIDLDLPWSYHDHGKDQPAPPDFTRRIKQEFGTTPTDEWNKITRQEHSRYQTASADLTRKLEGSITPEEFLERLAEAYEFNRSVQKVVAYHKLLRRIREWQDEQPESVAYQEALQQWHREQKQKSFCGRGLNVPGTLVEIRDDEGVKQYLIGDINTIAGVCDDCTGFDTGTARVLRYKVVWTPA